MPRVELEALLQAGTHFGHLTRRWNPKMRPYIFMERNGIHILDLKKTQEMLDAACNAVSNVVAEGKRPLFVGTKVQARDVVREEAITLQCVLCYRTLAWRNAHEFFDHSKKCQAFNEHRKNGNRRNIRKHHQKRTAAVNA